MSTLSPKDADLYYALFLPLLQYANKRLKKYPRINFATAKEIDPAAANEIATWIWGHTKIIDEYLESNPDLPQDHREIVAGWKRCIHHIWIIERHLKSGSIFLGRSPYAFLVKGIVTPIEEIAGDFRTPICIQGTLLPFRDCIITDGLISIMPLSMGPGMCKMFKDEYMNARKNGKVIKSLTDEIYQAVMAKKNPEPEESKIIPFPSVSSSAELSERAVPYPEEDEYDDAFDDDDDDLFPGEMPEENRRYLDFFQEDLQRSNLSEKTIERHLDNADLFLNDYLWYRDDETKMEQGTGRINSFMSFFIESLWASPTSIRQIAASLKKFYKSMLARNLIQQKDYDDLTITIKSCMDDWLEDLRSFDQDDSDDWL